MIGYTFLFLLTFPYMLAFGRPAVWISLGLFITCFTIEKWAQVTATVYPYLQMLESIQ